MHQGFGKIKEVKKKPGRGDTNTAEATQLKTACATEVHTEGTGGSRQKPEQREATLYIIVGYKNVNKFYKQTRQEQDGIKEDVPHASVFPHA